VIETFPILEENCELYDRSKVKIKRERSKNGEGKGTIVEKQTERKGKKKEGETVVNAQYFAF